LNGDNKLDLAAVCVENDKLTILIGDGKGKFGQKSVLDASGDPLWILAADFNGDGKTDLATLGDSVASIFLGKGDGTFFPKRDQPPSSGETLSSFAAVDLDLDGNLDLVLANSGSGTLSLLTGDGRGEFSGRRGRVSLLSGSKPQGIAVGDLNGDGKPDLAVALSNVNMVELLQNTTSVVSTVVPIVLSVSGQNDSFYTSEMTITNRGTTATDIRLTYTPFFGGWRRNRRQDDRYRHTIDYPGCDFMATHCRSQRSRFRQSRRNVGRPIQSGFQSVRRSSDGKGDDENIKRSCRTGLP
jgi:hypothetical protein